MHGRLEFVFEIANGEPFNLAVRFSQRLRAPVQCVIEVFSKVLAVRAGIRRVKGAVQIFDVFPSRLRTVGGRVRAARTLARRLVTAVAAPVAAWGLLVREGGTTRSALQCR